VEEKSLLAAQRVDVRVGCGETAFDLLLASIGVTAKFGLRPRSNNCSDQRSLTLCSNPARVKEFLGNRIAVAWERHPAEWRHVARFNSYLVSLSC
jgi:hypothetical protein